MGFSDPWNMQDLLQSNQHLDKTYYLSIQLNQNKFGPRKSNLQPLLFKKKHLFKKMDSLFCFTVIGNLQAVIYVTKWYLSLSHFRCSQCSPLARRS